MYDCLLLAPGINLRPKPSSLPENSDLFHSGDHFSAGERVAFLLDCEQPSDPFAGISAIRAAFENVVNGGVSAVYYRHIPVPHMWGEKISEEARLAGVHFVRVAEGPSVIPSSGAGETPAAFTLTATDIIDPTEEFVFDADRVVAVTGPDASTIPGWAREIMGRRNQDDQGFALSQSIHCISGSSFASGIFVVGEATGSLDLIGCVAQSQSAAANAYAWVRTSYGKTTNETVSVGQSCCTVSDLLPGLPS